MATTTPNNIPSPDSGSNYDPTVHMTALADGVQDALTERANYGTGTSTEMAAAVGRFPDGAMWYNTTDNKEYRREGGAWVAQEDDTGWVTLTPSSTYDNTGAAIRRLNGVIYCRGTLTKKTGTVALGDTFAYIPEQFRPTFSRNFISHGQGALIFRVVLQSSDGRLYCNSNPDGAPSYVQLDPIVFAL